MTAGEKGISISSIWQVHNRETEDGVELDKDSGTNSDVFAKRISRFVSTLGSGE